MNRHLKLVATFASCGLWLVACSSSGAGNGGGSGGSIASGGSSSIGSGGSSAGGSAGNASGGVASGGTGSGGAATGGATGGAASGGSGGKSSGGESGATGGSGGKSSGGESGATGGSGSGGKGTGGSGSGGLGGVGTGGGGGAVGGSGGKTSGGTGGKGTGGAGTGGAASGGSTGSGGSTSSAVVPTLVVGRDRFAFGDVIFEVDPRVGARVATLSLAGANMLPASGSDTTTWGAVFWTSPQSGWDTNWPPPKAIDSDAYTGNITGTHLVLDSASYAALGVSVSKDFSADAATGWITVVYTIKASKAVKAAPWENCRVLRGGLAFFPAGTTLAKGPLTMTESASMVWFDDASKTATSASGEKAIADGSGGFMAYALGGNLLLRKFTDTPPNAIAPGEGDDEIYPGSGFLELEIQGPYTSIPAGGSLSWTVSWKLVKIPTSVTVSAGSTSLADFAKQQAGS